MFRYILGAVLALSLLVVGVYASTQVTNTSATAACACPLDCDLCVTGATCDDCPLCVVTGESCCSGSPCCYEGAPCCVSGAPCCESKACCESAIAACCESQAAACCQK